VLITKIRHEQIRKAVAAGRGSGFADIELCNIHDTLHCHCL